MSKFIIEIRDNIGDYEALEAVMSVITSGRISKNDTMYCYHTVFNNSIHVSFIEKRKHSKSEKIIVHKNIPKSLKSLEE
jgi:hypothetical protein